MLSITFLVIILAIMNLVSNATKPVNHLFPVSINSTDTSKQETLPCSIQQETPPCTTQQETLPCSIQQDTLPCTTQQETLPCSIQQETPPCTTQQETLPCATQQETLPCTAQQETLPCATQQETLPCETQQDTLPCTTKQVTLPCETSIEYSGARGIQKTHMSSKENQVPFQKSVQELVYVKLLNASSLKRTTVDAKSDGLHSVINNHLNKVQIPSISKNLFPYISSPKKEMLNQLTECMFNCSSTGAKYPIKKKFNIFTPVVKYPNKRRSNSFPIVAKSLIKRKPKCFTQTVTYPNKRKFNCFTPVVKYSNKKKFNSSIPVFKYLSKRKSNSFTPVVTYSSKRRSNSFPPVIKYSNKRKSNSFTPVVKYSNKRKSNSSTTVVKFPNKRKSKCFSTVTKCSNKRRSNNSTTVIQHPITNTVASDQNGRTMTATNIQENIKCSNIKSSSDCMKLLQEENNVNNDAVLIVNSMEKLLKNKERFRRETTARKYVNNEASKDKSLLMSNLYPLFYHDKRSDSWQDLQTYLEDSSLGSMVVPQTIVNVPEYVHDSVSTTNNKQHLTEDLQLIDDDIDQVLEILEQYMSIDQNEVNAKINFTLLLEKVLKLNIPHRKMIKEMLQNEHARPKNVLNQSAGDMSNVRESYYKTCRDSPILKFPFLKRLSNPKQKDYWSASCLTLSKAGTPELKTVIKKSIVPLSGSSNSQNRVRTESCSHVIETTVITLPGCVPKSVLITKCQGTCSSRSVPEWNLDSQDIRRINHCTCCSSFVIKSRAITFQCPRKPEGRLVITLGYPFRCACRPCTSVPEVTAQQPYDY